jgi:pimeloyl-ACP methyl ester carboxylesterase
MIHNVNGSQLSVTAYGEGSAVLLLHGFPFTGAMWEPVARLLARLGRRVLVPDLRGFGASTGVPAEALRDHADDLVGVLDALELHEPVPWIGFSMGGYIALEAWRRHPGRIGRLGLVDTRAGPDDDTARAGRLATALRVEKEGSAVVADAMLPKLFSPQTTAPRRASHHAAMKAAAPLHVAAALRAMAGRADSRPLLATISVPTVVVVGADDVITPPAEAQALVKGIPRARLHVIAAAGHMAPVEQPDAVASALADLLA